MSIETNDDKKTYRSPWEDNEIENDSTQIEKISNGISHYENVFIERYMIGRGGFGLVYRAQNRFDDQEYAVKKIILPGGILSQRILREVKIWANLDSDFIVRYKSSWTELGDLENMEKMNPTNLRKSHIFFIQMELCLMTLRDAFGLLKVEVMLNGNKGISVIGAYIATELFTEILEGVKYLHSQEPPIIQRDLKMSNILITKGLSGKFIKIGDFGLSKLHGYHNESQEDKNDFNINYQHSLNAGTESYMAAEMKYGKYDTASDMYSLGGILCELFGFKSRDFRNFENEYKDQYGYQPKRQVNLMRNLLQVWPSKRSNCEKLLYTKEEWAVSFEEIKFCKELRNIFFNWWEKIFNGGEKNDNLISAKIIMAKFRAAILENLINKNSITYKVPQKKMSEFNILRSTLSEKVRFINQISNIKDEGVIRNILKIVLHSLNICEDFTELCMFVEKNLKENTLNYWHCFSTAMCSAKECINWFDIPYYKITFLDEILSLTFEIIIIETQISEILKKKKLDQFSDIQNIIHECNEKIASKALNISFAALSCLTIKEMQTYITDCLKREFKNEDWYCFASRNELISFHNIYPPPEIYLALRIGSYCIFIANRSLELMDSIFFNREKGILSEMPIEDKNVLERTFLPTFINSHLVLKQVELNNGKICFVRVFENLESSSSFSISYKFHMYDVQIVWIRNNASYSEITGCSNMKQRIFKRFTLKQNEINAEILILSKFSLTKETKYEDIINFLKSIKNLWNSDFNFRGFIENYSSVFDKCIQQLVELAKTSLSQLKVVLVDQHAIMNNFILQTLDLVLRRANKYLIHSLALDFLEIYANLLKSNDDNICFLAITAINVFSKHCLQCFKKCIEANAFPPLLELIDPFKSLAIITAASSLLPELFTPSRIELLSDELVKNIIKVVELLIDHSDEQIVIKMICIIRLLVVFDRYLMKVLIEAGIIQKVVKLLIHENQRIHSESLEVLYNILRRYYNYEKTPFFHPENFTVEIYTALKSILKSCKNYNRQSALFILILTQFKKEEDIKPLVESDLINHLISMVGDKKCSDWRLAAMILERILMACSEEESLLYIFSNRVLSSFSRRFSYSLSDEEFSNFSAITRYMLSLLYAKWHLMILPQIKADIVESGIIDRIKHYETDE